MAWVGEREIEGLIVRFVEQGEKRRVGLSASDITQAISMLSESTKFPPLMFKKTKRGVFSPEVAYAFSSLSRANELKCEDKCRLTELGKLANNSLAASLKRSLEPFGLNLTALDASISSVLGQLKAR